MPSFIRNHFPARPSASQSRIFHQGTYRVIPRGCFDYQTRQFKGKCFKRCWGGGRGEARCFTVCIFPVLKPWFSFNASRTLTMTSVLREVSEAHLVSCLGLRRENRLACALPGPAAQSHQAGSGCLLDTEQSRGCT